MPGLRTKRGFLMTQHSECQIITFCSSRTMYEMYGCQLNPRLFVSFKNNTSYWLFNNAVGRKKKQILISSDFSQIQLAGHFWSLSDGISYTETEDLHVTHVINQCAQWTLQQHAISAHYNRMHILLFLYKNSNLQIMWLPCTQWLFIKLKRLVRDYPASSYLYAV